MPITKYTSPQTNLAISANEGTLASVSGSAPGNFTFDIPAGLWVSASLEIAINNVFDPKQYGGQYFGGTYYPNYYVTFSALATLTGGPAPKSTDFHGGVSTYIAKPLHLLSDAVNSGNTQVVQTYPALSYLTNAGTATIRVTVAPPGSAPDSNNADTALQNVTATLRLSSILPGPALCTLAATSTSAKDPATGADVLPLTGTASLSAADPTQNTVDQYGSPLPPGQGNGFEPYAYLWTVTDSAGSPPDTLTGQGTNRITWSYAYSGANAGFYQNYEDVTVSCLAVDSLYPAQVLDPGTYYAPQPDCPSFVMLTQQVGYGNVRAKAAVAAFALGEDAHRRSIVISSSHVSLPGVSGFVLNDPETPFHQRAYLGTTLSSSAPVDNPCLLIDRRSNHYRVLTSVKSAAAFSLQCYSGILDDKFTQEAGSPAAIPNLSGGYPCAAQHPAHDDYALLAYLDVQDGNTLKTACSLDAGKTWTPLGTIMSGLDLAGQGRPALCWVGETAILVYSTGNAMQAVKSVDRGKTWAAAPAPVSVYTPNAALSYYCLSLASHDGQIYLLAFVGNTQASEQYASPRLFVSGDLGQTWMLRAANLVNIYSSGGGEAIETSYAPAGTLPSFVPPTGIGISAFSGLIRLGTSYLSNNGGISVQ